MKKGKFGIVLCFYPIAAFAAVILNSMLIAAAMAAVAIFIEKDEWASRQSLQAWMASVLVFFVDKAARLMSSNVYIPVISTVLSVVSTVVFVVVYLAAILFSVLAIIRVMRGGEANLPILAELAYRLYGKTKPKPLPTSGQYPPPYAQPGQPVYPNPAPPQAPQYPQPNMVQPQPMPYQPIPQQPQQVIPVQPQPTPQPLQNPAPSAPVDAVSNDSNDTPDSSI